MPSLRAAEALSASFICLFSTVSTLSSKCGKLQTPSLHVSRKAGDFEEHTHTHFESHIVLTLLKYPHNTHTTYLTHSLMSWRHSITLILSHLSTRAHTCKSVLPCLVSFYGERYTEWSWESSSSTADRNIQHDAVNYVFFLILPSPSHSFAVSSVFFCLARCELSLSLSL